MDLAFRNRAEEMMDDPNMELEVLQKAYDDINLCNRILGGESITINAVWKIIQNSKQESYTILDMGCGDGTMLLKLSDFLSKNGVFHKMRGIDQRADVLAIAKRKSRNHPNIEFTKMDILKADDSLKSDIVINTLTMHHFEEERIEAFLSKFIQLAKLGIVINDLERSRISYVLFKLFSAVFIKTDVAKNDGLVSISKGFKKRELQELSEKIPNVTHQIRWKWAFRYVWVMKINRQFN